MGTSTRVQGRGEMACATSLTITVRCISLAHCTIPSISYAFGHFTVCCMLDARCCTFSFLSILRSPFPILHVACYTSTLGQFQVKFTSCRKRCESECRGLRFAVAFSCRLTRRYSIYEKLSIVNRQPSFVIRHSSLIIRQSSIVAFTHCY